MRAVLGLALALVLVTGLDHAAQAGALDDMISPMSVPTINEDPRMSTELRPMYMYTRISDDFVTGGGNYSVVAVQARAAITDRIGFIATKDGYIFLKPDGVVPDADGFANIAFGFKGALVRNDETGSIVTAGLRYEAPSGNRDVLQGNGRGVLNPFVTAAQAFGNFHAQLYAGPRVPIHQDDSTFMDLSWHMDYKIGCLYPLLEFNWIDTVDGGRRLPIDQEGFDLVNIGSRQAGGESVATTAFGLRWRIIDDLDVGAVAEFPVTAREDLFGWRVTTDLIWRPMGWKALF